MKGIILDESIFTDIEYYILPFLDPETTKTFLVSYGMIPNHLYINELLMIAVKNGSLFWTRQFLAGGHAWECILAAAVHGKNKDVIDLIIEYCKSHGELLTYNLAFGAAAAIGHLEFVKYFKALGANEIGIAYKNAKKRNHQNIVNYLDYL